LCFKRAKANDTLRAEERSSIQIALFLPLQFISLTMPEPNPFFLTDDLDPKVLRRLDVCEGVCLGSVVALAAMNLAVGTFSHASHVPLTGWPLMSGQVCFAALLSAMSLYFVRVSGARFPEIAAMTLAAAIAVLGTVAFVEHVVMLAFGHFFASGARPVSLPPFIWGISPNTAGGFALVGISTCFLHARRRLSILTADIVTCGLLFLALTLLSGQIIDSMRIFGPPVEDGVSLQCTICLFLLTVVIVARKSRSGLFAVFARRGAGSKLARNLSPILLVMPYVREFTRAHLISWRSMPPPYATAMIATMIVIVSTSLMLYLAWRINCMEVEIQTLSLRDELTGLYNLRGFKLLAEHAQRMAYRSGDPFSVLFIDLDNLKRINDQLGHQAGSDYISETAEILKTAFRESDVIGRIGGDEFVVAGEFNRLAIVSAAGRLKDLAAQRSSEDGRRIKLSFSVGHVTSQVGIRESLDSLLAKADGAMYEEKRRRKELAEV
jgi:diguanylate cyclase (GGDEF)-like protein